MRLRSGFMSDGAAHAMVVAQDIACILVPTICVSLIRFVVS